MSRDSGEFELILGNKQLLSVLFIVIVLLGVFFAMGFLAGRTTATGTAQSPPKVVNNAPPLVVEPTPKESPAAPAKEVAPEKKEIEDLVKIERKPEAVEEAKAAPPKRGAAKAEPSSAASSGGFTENPPKGQYIQVAATKRPDADALLAQLAKNGMSGYITPAPKSADLLRVIVGPLADSEQVAETREKLKKVGIDKGFIVKY